VKATEEKLLETYRRTQSYVGTAKELGLSRQAVRNRIINLHFQGYDLVLPKDAGTRKAKHNDPRKQAE
jgi:biotin operon repressor